MTHEKYWDYLDDIGREIEARYPLISPEGRYMLLKLTASPYHYWLNNQEIADDISSPKASAEKGRVEDISPETSSTGPSNADASNLANKAQEIREKARTSIKAYMKTHEKQWSSEASTSLWALAADWGKGMTVYKALDLIPDRELCLWNDKHEVFT